MPETKLEEKLISIFGQDDVLFGTAALKAYSTDASPFTGNALAVVRPESQSEISDLLKLAARHSIPVTPRGSGTGTSGGAVPSNSIVVDMKKMDRIEIYEEDMVAYVQAGAIIHDLKKELEKHGLFLPPEPGSVRIATIGGFVANNGGGKRGLKYGSIRNFVTGVEAVLPDGETINTGSRTHRNPECAAGIFAGSEGRFGIITGIYLKTLPLPECRHTALVRVSELSELPVILKRILKLLPDAVEFIDRRCVELLDLGAEELIAVEFFTSESEMDKLGIRYEKLEGREERKFWEMRETLGVEIAKKGTRIYAAEDFAVPFSKLAGFISAVYSLEERYSAEVYIYGHLDTANIHPAIVSNDFSSSLMFAEELYSIAEKFEATIGEHGAGRRWDVKENDLYRRLKRCLDTGNILNP
ncbi:FAD-binding protein [Geoglobus acetivorans]|uniref:FAD-binding oxidoreductase n=1 Tax=Geoglobus acetivorans TaxID=565033 RepID=A0ABZ3H4A9_GEOAI|nr:FAD-binding oxidoreductase [Geoglobus acetivorans]